MNKTHPATTRRDFLKTTTFAAGAVTLGPVDISQMAHAAGSDIIKVGMIGSGGRAAGAAMQALAADKGARLTAMCDVLPERIQERLQLIKASNPDQCAVDAGHCFSGFDGYQGVIESSDVVLIANAAKFHPFHAMEAIKAGRHVFVEKPHGIDPAGVKLMQKACDLAREKKLSVVSGLQSRYHAGYVETIKRIRDGAIGDILTIEENFLRPPYGVTERKPELTELQWQTSTQYHFRWLSGDDVPQSLVHNMDRASWVLGNAAPLHCHGMGGRSTMIEPIYGDVFDHHAVVYEFERGVKAYAFCRTTAGCYDENSSVIIGTKGKAILTRSILLGENRWKWEGQCDPYQVEHDKLFAAIRAGEPINNGDYMVRSTMITVMGQISCYTGKEVTWEQVNASDFHYPPAPEECKDGMEPPTKPDATGSYPTLIPGRTKLI